QQSTISRLQVNSRQPSSKPTAALHTYTFALNRSITSTRSTVVHPRIQYSENTEEERSIGYSRAKSNIHPRIKYNGNSSAVRSGDYSKMDTHHPNDWRKNDRNWNKRQGESRNEKGYPSLDEIKPRDMYCEQKSGR
ncbi:hypothetical protein PFISCL1PPCAC_27880, partial [Pristionchus fissidentatus]